MEGQGHFNWTQGHEYIGHFRAGQMDGKGEFKHVTGKAPLKGNFKRNQFQRVSNTVCKVEANQGVFFVIGEMLCESTG